MDRQLIEATYNFLVDLQRSSSGFSSNAVLANLVSDIGDHVVLTPGKLPLVEVETALGCTSVSPDEFTVSSSLERGSGFERPISVVRVTHVSGAYGESKKERSHYANQQAAWIKCVAQLKRDGIAGRVTGGKVEWQCGDWKEFEGARLYLKPPLGAIKEQLKIQGSDGNWNYDPYMHGMFNGLECALATLEKREPEYRKAPAEWLCNKKKTYDLVTGKHQCISACDMCKHTLGDFANCNLFALKPVGICTGWEQKF